jgi:hypothetical protein
MSGESWEERRKEGFFNILCKIIYSFGEIFLIISRIGVRRTTTADLGEKFQFFEGIMAK